MKKWKFLVINRRRIIPVQFAVSRWYWNIMGRSMKR